MLAAASLVAAMALAPDLRAETMAAVNPAILPYLVECALPEGDAVTLSHAGETMFLTGSIGLAPAWRNRPLTLAEQRWLSACLLARTNLHGRKVQISLRALPPAPPALMATRDERGAFAVFEGGFFGNLFAERPTAFVCGPDHDETAAAELGDRLCALKRDDGPQTMCGFTHVGPCPMPDGSPVIYVFLQGAP